MVAFVDRTFLLWVGEPADPVRPRRLDGAPVGWSGTDVLRAPHHLSVNSVCHLRTTVLRDDGSEPQSMDGRSAGTRGLAQQSTRSHDPLHGLSGGSSTLSVAHAGFERLGLARDVQRIAPDVIARGVSAKAEDPPGHSTPSNESSEEEARAQGLDPAPSPTLLHVPRIARTAPRVSVRRSVSLTDAVFEPSAPSRSRGRPRSRTSRGGLRGTPSERRQASGVLVATPTGALGSTVGPWRTRRPTRSGYRPARSAMTWQPNSCRADAALQAGPIHSRHEGIRQPGHGQVMTPGAVASTITW